MKLYISDLYRVETHYPLDEITHDILYYLYLPIISSLAVSTYMLLYTESRRMLKDASESSIARMCDYLGISLEELEKALLKLEGIGLLKSYVKHGDISHYCYVLLAPLSLQRFFKNQILSSLLKESLSHEDFKKTVEYFKYVETKKDEYEEITASFNDIFEISNKPIALHIRNLKEKESNEIHFSFDEQLLKKQFREYQIPARLLSKEDLQNISDLASVYSMDTITVTMLVKDSIEHDAFSLKKFKLLIQDYFDADSYKLTEVFYKQPALYKTSGSNPLELHMQYLDNLTPYELLREKQGGKEPVYHDLKIIETLMSQLSLNPSVVNVLIEYVLGKSNGRLSSSYCEAIGSTLARKKVKTAMEAYQVLKQSPQSSDVVEEKDRKLKVEETDEMNQLWNELKEYVRD